MKNGLDLEEIIAECLLISMNQRAVGHHAFSTGVIDVQASH